MSTEVLVTVGRRSWPNEVKRQMIAEAAQPGSSISAVARMYSIDPGQLYQWRKKLKAHPPAQQPDAQVDICDGPSAPGGDEPDDANRTAAQRSHFHAACIFFCRSILIRS